MNLLKIIKKKMKIKESKIKTFDGTKHLKSECRKYSQGYYKIGDIKVKDSGQCYLIEDKYYRIDSGFITYDYEKEQYVLISKENLINGIVDYKNDNFVYGDFSVNNIRNVKVKLKENHIVECLDESIINLNREFRERLSDGIFYSIKQYPASFFVDRYVINEDYKRSLDYEASNSIKSIVKIFDKSYNYISDSKINRFSTLLKGLSFGLEFETISGFIPKRFCYKYGLIPLRDGSISGLEYATIPLSEERGVTALLEGLRVLEERTSYDKTCSLHLHMGNIPRTMEFIIAFFKIICMIQDELYTAFPLYKKYNFGIKNKNYTKPFPVFGLYTELDKIINSSNIKTNFNVILKYLCGRSLQDFGPSLDNIEFHPNDRQNDRKWNVSSRYHIVNIIPLIFGNKQTVEFRYHTPTYDKDKILYFLLICGSIINYTIRNTTNILLGRIKNVNIIEIIQHEIGDSSVRAKLQIYLQSRMKFTELKNRDGQINYDENDYNVPKQIKNYLLEQPKKVNLKKASALEEFQQRMREDLGIGLRAEADFIQRMRIRRQ